MRSLYNILQLVTLIFFLPLLALMALFSSKYKERIPQRLGIDLQIPAKKSGRPRIWIHALSVGEVTSAKPLVKALRQKMPECELLFSSVTQGGQLMAKEISTVVDQFIPFPFDLFFTVQRFVKKVKPDIFVLVETDFWPNIIWQLQRDGVPYVLVNGRIAQKSFARYKLLKPLFSSFFDSFAALSMQMDSGRLQLRQLGIASQKITSYGNLKFDLELKIEDAPDLTRMTNCFRGRYVVVAGSTHDGEERIILESFDRLRKTRGNLLLVIAPRNIERSRKVYEMAVASGFDAALETDELTDLTQVIILNTLGELVYLYSYADIAFVGGSLVDERGHNPLEPAYWGKPVVYGPYMADFKEASQGLLRAGAARQTTPKDFGETIGQLCADPQLCVKMGSNASKFVMSHRGAARKYADLIQQIVENHVS
nr:3-deoxy-D-manno-octulosonic acid transferase [Desulfobulbaceae bacterium]